MPYQALEPAFMITYASMAMAAGEDDADKWQLVKMMPTNSSPGGVSPLSRYLWPLRCESPQVRSWRRECSSKLVTLDELRILDQVEELRGCDKRLTACMLNRLGDLQL